MLATIFLCAAAGASAPQVGPGGVPAALWSKFRVGVNITRWFCYEGVSGGSKHWEGYLANVDFANFKRLKVTFVRLCVSPDLAIKEGRLNPEVAPHLDRALDRFQRAGIAVVFDLHDNGQLKLDGQDARSGEFQGFWRDVATRYRGRRLLDVAFELVNEPVYRTNPGAWYELQTNTVRLVREIDPARTLIVTGTSWSGIDQFVTLPVLREENLIYTFHCYDPFFFTHQGATWAGEEAKGVKNMPFPSSPEAVAPIMSAMEERLRPIVRDYGEQRFDARYLRARIKKAADWGREKGLPVFLGEFGVYPPVAPPDARGRWFEAMRNAVDAEGVPHALWGYDDALGLGRRAQADGKVWLDPVTLRHFYRDAP